ncbi:unnamed protein product, partial [Medioppia subpectinata]
LGRILGACSGVNIGPDLSFVGQYAVRAEYQGLGIGKALWVKAMKNMGDRNASLFAATVKIFTIYRDVHHFSAVPKKRIIHMKGEFAPNIDITDRIDGISLMAINEDNIRDVIEYDKQVCDGLDRSAMLSALYKSPENINLVAVNERNQVLGYCFVLDTSSGVTGITPLYADNQQIAELLANKCCQRLPTHKTKKMLYLCWDSNPNSIAVAEKLGLNPKCIFVAQDIDSGKLLGMTSGINISPELAHVGQYGVKRDYQGLGIGSALWEQMMAHMGDRNVSLYASDLMVAKYKVHFSFVPERRLVHFTGNVTNNNLVDSIDGISLVPIDKSNIGDVIEYDKTVTNGVDRRLMFEALYKTPETVNLVAINEKNKVLGYCVLFSTNLSNLVLVEPLYADNQQIAELLISKCCQRFPETKTHQLLYLCWDSNNKSMEIALKLGLKRKCDQPILFNPKCIFVAQDIDSGKLLGMTSGINISPELAHVGQYGVKPEYQGLGIGSALWDQMMAHMGDRNVSLYAATPKIFAKYSINFPFVPERRLVHFRGYVNTSNLVDSIDGMSLVPIDDNNIGDVIKYDKTVTNGVDRRPMFEALYKTRETLTTGMPTKGMALD